jgi:hypothetical protein
MLMNPLHDPYSLQSLTVWLEQKDPAKPYGYYDSSTCLIAQYLKSKHIKPYDIPNLVDAGLDKFGIIASRHPHTYGAALERAKALT